MEKSQQHYRTRLWQHPCMQQKIYKIKTKSYDAKISTTFHNNKIPKEGSEYICLTVILLDWVYKKDKNYYPQVFLEECQYVIKENKSVKNFITGNL